MSAGLPPELAALLAHPLMRRAREVAQAQGVPVLLVGGAVRDALLHHETNDFDFAVQGNAIRLARKVADALGAHFYVLDEARDIGRVVIPASADRAPATLDFAACVGETWADDLRARDFTVNAIGVDLASGALVDTMHGVQDLRARVLRLAHPDALRADPVRALRAIRLSHALEMKLDPALAQRLPEARAMLTQPSAERLRDELFEMLKLPRASAAIRALDAFALLDVLIPEIAPLRAQAQSAPHAFNVLEHTFAVLRALDAGEAALGRADDETRAWLGVEVCESRTRLSLLRFAALLHDCAKPEDAHQDAEGRWHFPHHAERSAERAAHRGRALRLSTDEVRWVHACIQPHTRLNQRAQAETPPDDSALYRLLQDLGDVTPAAALLTLADCWGRRGEATAQDACAPQATFARTVAQAYFRRWLPLRAAPPLITGHDLIALGVAPGPQLGALLDVVREAQFCNLVHTREEALAFVERRIEGR